MDDGGGRRGEEDGSGRTAVGIEDICGIGHGGYKRVSCSPVKPFGSIIIPWYIGKRMDKWQEGGGGTRRRGRRR